MIVLQLWTMQICNGIVCPNFGHPVLTSSFTKNIYIFAGENMFATIVQLVLKCFQLWNGDLSTASIYKVGKPKMMKL